MKKFKIFSLSLIIVIYFLIPLAADANCMWTLNAQCRDIGTTNIWVPATADTHCNSTVKPNGTTAKCCCAGGDIAGCCEKTDSNGVITTADMSGMNCKEITYATTNFYQDKEAVGNQCVDRTMPGCSWSRVVTNGMTRTVGNCGDGYTKSADSQCSSTKPADGVNTYSICCCPSQTNTEPATPPKFIMPELQISIPGLKLTPSSSLKTISNDDGGYSVTIPWLSEYLLAIYNYGLAVAGILAAIILMAGGVFWLISGGDASRITLAKELITGSITGLVILMSSYLILSQINPDLTQFNPITIGTVKKIDLIANGSDSDNNTATVASCLSDAELFSIKGTVTISNVSDPRLSQNAVSGLKKAIAEAKKQGVELLVTSANRGYAKQKELWDAELKKFKGDEAKTRIYVANPSNCTGGKCYSHCAGVAIDVCLKGSPSCGKMNSANAKANDADIFKLQTIMKNAGWLRYCGEWWHFQYGLAPGKSCSP